MVFGFIPQRQTWHFTDKNFIKRPGKTKTSVNDPKYCSWDK